MQNACRSLTWVAYIGMLLLLLLPRLVVVSVVLVLQ
jgi:hypothetical protein